MSKKDEKIAELEAKIEELEVLSHSFSHDREFVITQNKVLAKKVKRLEYAAKFLISDIKQLKSTRDAVRRYYARVEDL